MSPFFFFSTSQNIVKWKKGNQIPTIRENKNLTGIKYLLYYNCSNDEKPPMRSRPYGVLFFLYSSFFCKSPIKDILLPTALVNSDEQFFIEGAKTFNNLL